MRVEPVTDFLERVIVFATQSTGLSKVLSCLEQALPPAGLGIKLSYDESNEHFRGRSVKAITIQVTRSVGKMRTLASGPAVPPLQNGAPAA